MVKINPTFGKPMMGLTGTQFLGKNTASGEAEADKAICEHRKEPGTGGGGGTRLFRVKLPLTGNCHSLNTKLQDS